LHRDQADGHRLVRLRSRQAVTFTQIRFFAAMNQ
jgi:hypothetical protein